MTYTAFVRRAAIFNKSLIKYPVMFFGTGTLSNRPVQVVYFDSLKDYPVAEACGDATYPFVLKTNTSPVQAHNEIGYGNSVLSYNFDPG